MKCVWDFFFSPFLHSVVQKKEKLIMFYVPYIYYIINNMENASCIVRLQQPDKEQAEKNRKIRREQIAMRVLFRRV